MTAGISSVRNFGETDPIPQGLARDRFCFRNATWSRAVADAMAVYLINEEIDLTGSSTMRKNLRRSLMDEATPRLGTERLRSRRTRSPLVRASMIPSPTTSRPTTLLTFAKASIFHCDVKRFKLCPDVEAGICRYIFFGDDSSLDEVEQRIRNLCASEPLVLLDLAL